MLRVNLEQNKAASSAAAETTEEGVDGAAEVVEVGMEEEEEV